MKNIKVKVIAVLALLIFAALYYYFTLPAINIHSAGFWFFIMLLIGVVLVAVILPIIFKSLTVTVGCIVVGVITK
jgi:hypothetical protein